MVFNDLVLKAQWEAIIGSIDFNTSSYQAFDNLVFVLKLPLKLDGLDGHPCEGSKFWCGAAGQAFPHCLIESCDFRSSGEGGMLQWSISELAAWTANKTQKV